MGAVGAIFDFRFACPDEALCEVGSIFDLSERRGHLSSFVFLLAAGCSVGPSPDRPGGDLDAVAGGDSRPGPDNEGGALEVVAGEGAFLSGRLVGSDGLPVPKAMLVLCGNLHGVEVCNQKFSTQDGSFEYENLEPGYSHLNIFPYMSAAATGKHYGGAALAVSTDCADATDSANNPPSCEVALGDIPIPIAESTHHLVVADGTSFSQGPITVAIPPASLTFPDVSPEGPVGLVNIPLDCLPFPAPAAFHSAHAFHPFGAGLSVPALVTISDTPSLCPNGSPLVYTNPTSTGGLVESSLVDSALELPELTWLVLACP